MRLSSRAGLSLLVTGPLCLLGCRAELASDLDEAQAAAVVLALDEAGIGAAKEPGSGADQGRFRVSVAQADVPAGLAVLRDRDLPREPAPGLAELFAERGLVPSPSEERARHAAAMAGELARSLESFEGVARARLHLALPDSGGRLLDAAAARPSASVLLVHRPGTQVDDAAVRALVAGAVPELAEEDVAVVRTELSSPPPRDPDLVHLGPIAVTRSSATTLKAVLAASFASNLILVAALVLSRARRRASNHPKPAQDAPTPHS